MQPESDVAPPVSADPELADLAHRVREGVGRLNWRMRAERDPSGPGPAVLAVLSRLYRAGTHTPTELAEAERLQPQSLTRILAWVTERELVTRSPDPADGRRSLVSITPAGLAVLRADSVRPERWLGGAVETTPSPAGRPPLETGSGPVLPVADA